MLAPPADSVAKLICSNLKSVSVCNNEKNFDPEVYDVVMSSPRGNEGPKVLGGFSFQTELRMLMQEKENLRTRADRLQRLLWDLRSLWKDCCLFSRNFFTLLLLHLSMFPVF